MRLRHLDGQIVHLGYCTNIHPAENLAGVLTQLDTYAAAVRQHLEADVLGLGLWLAPPVAAALADVPGARRKLRRELDVRGLEVVTLNGLPHRSVHAPEVKDGTGRPDWTSRKHLEYILDLARILADLLPEDAAGGSVSTLPPAGPDAPPSVVRMLDELAEGLTEVAWRSGRLVRVGFEPRPGSVETSAQMVDALGRVDTDRIGVCLDLAHLACAWENPAGALATLASAGLPVVKVQISAALEVLDPAAAEQALRPYIEPRLPGETRNNAGAGAEELEAALALGEELPGPWRVHHHLPVYATPAPPLASTIPVLRAALDALVGGVTAACDHFEVETYTWDSMPDRPRGAAEFAAGIGAELGFARDELMARGLTPLGTQGQGRWPGATALDRRV